MPPKRKDDDTQTKLTRIAVVMPDRCKPKKCNLECKKVCPVNKQGKQCIMVESTSTISVISEELCIGCGMCVKRCPFGAIQIINIPSNLDAETTHRYGPNSFKLHRLPLPRPGQVLGLVGANGTGKSTALSILKGKIKPNLGRFKNEPTWEDILKYFRGSEHQAYFQHLLEDKVKALLKPQYVDQVPKTMKGPVQDVLIAKNERGMLDHYVEVLDLKNVMTNNIEKLSGGELQRFTIAVVCNQEAGMYMFDEPSSYLDVRQRIQAAHAIRGLLTPTNYVICVEHDLAVVDYLSDFVCVLYGRPGAYGVVTMPYGVREGINVFLEGFVPTENMRFRDESLTFHMAEEQEDVGKRVHEYTYPAMSKKLGNFTLNVDAGSFTDSEIVVLLGENGCGKTTLIKMLAGHEKPDNGVEVPQLRVSYKPQKISPKFTGSVRDLLQTKISTMLDHPQFKTDVINPLRIEELFDFEVLNLSGGELQRVGITLALGTVADIYLIDEPSAYLDSDQRIICARVIKRFILHSKKSAFIVEHDFIMATYLADRVIVYDGTPAINCTANAPGPLVNGMNKFLRQLDITFRRDPTNFRPRINKNESVKDREQKQSGNYFYMAIDETTGKARPNKDQPNHGAAVNIEAAEAVAPAKKGAAAKKAESSDDDAPLGITKKSGKKAKKTGKAAVDSDDE
jgi:ATP-binding cassette subfamily E protein 1